MCNLKVPFDASTLSGLIIKITRGEYDPIAAQYSTELRSLVGRLLSVEPKDRPDINQVLKLKFLKPYIESVLVSFEHLRREKMKACFDFKANSKKPEPEGITEGFTVAELIEKKLADLEAKLGADKLSLLYSSIKVSIV